MLIMTRQSGFSLIELVVTMLVAAVLTAIGAPYLTSWLANTKVNTAAEAVMSGMTLARLEAIQRNEPIQLDLNAGAGTWSFGCVTVTANCLAVIESKVSSEGASSVILTEEPAGATSVTFNGLGRVIGNEDGSDSLTAIVFTHGNANRIYRVELSSGGSARQCRSDGLLPPGDPREC